MRISDWSSDVCSSDLPERVALRVASLRWRAGLAPTPPELLPYTVHPWVVANDRLRADGWEPTSSNEEAYVGAHRAGPWATLSPRRRQELALGGAGALILGAVASDRQRVVSGKRVSVRVDPGGRRRLKKKHTQENIRR